jgi:hypothetical protein
LSDPSRPGLVKVKQMEGGITVQGYDGKEVIVEARPPGAKARGMEGKRVEALSGLEAARSGLRVEEADNVVTVSARPRGGGAVGLDLKVPVATSLKLSCMNAGSIQVENVEGEIEADCLNCSVVLTRVSGVVVAHSLNGDVLVRMARVTPGKPMSFSTLNGNIDVTLPPDLEAKFKLETQNGFIHNDFAGRLDGGGAEFRFKAVNGNIHLRKSK